LCHIEDFPEEVALIKCRAVIELANSRPRSLLAGAFHWLSGAFFNYDVGSQVIDARTGWGACVWIKRPQSFAARRCAFACRVCAIIIMA